MPPVILYFFLEFTKCLRIGKVITSQLIKGVLLEEGEIIQVNESHRRVLDVNPETRAKNSHFNVTFATQILLGRKL